MKVTFNLQTFVESIWTFVEHSYRTRTMPY